MNSMVFLWVEQKGQFPSVSNWYISIFLIHSSVDVNTALWILLQFSWECRYLFDILFSFPLEIYPAFLATWDSSFLTSQAKPSLGLGLLDSEPQVYQISSHHSGSNHTNLILSGVGTQRLLAFLGLLKVPGRMHLLKWIHIYFALSNLGPLR